MLTPRLEISLFHRRFPAYLFFGLIGYFAGCGLGIALTVFRGLDLGVILLLCSVSAATFFALAWTVKIITGREIMVYYHHEISILSTCTLTLLALGKPVLPYLEISLLGIGTLLFFGRWGCFSVGCCHGKPCKCRIGVAYSQAHGDAGFPRYYVGLKMFPIALIESAWVFITVVVSACLVVIGYPVGTALIFYTTFYGTARFFFEFLRGDPERPYFLGFSEAQWTTLLLLLLSGFLSAFGILPFYGWHIGIVLALFSFMLLFSIFRPLLPNLKSQVLHPRHVREVAIGIAKAQTPLNTSRADIPIARTSLGLNISVARTPADKGLLTHYTISAVQSRIILDKNVTRSIAELIQLIQHRNTDFEIREGQQHIFHILFYEKSNVLVPYYS